MTPPRLSRVLSPSPPPTVEHGNTNSFYNPNWGPGYPKLFTQQYEGFDEFMTSVFDRVRRLSSTTSELYKPSFNPALQQEYTKNLLLLEQMMNSSSWFHQPDHSSFEQAQYATTETRICAPTWHASTLLYIYIILRKMPSSTTLVQKILGRVTSTLQALTPTELWCHFPKNFLLWVLTLGGVACTNRPHDLDWYVMCLRHLRGIMGLEEWVDVKQVLTGFAWVEYMCELVFRRVWEKVLAVESAEQGGK